MVLIIENFFHIKIKKMKALHFLHIFMGALLLSIVSFFLTVIMGLPNSLSGLVWSILPNFLITTLLVFYLLNSTLNGIKAVISVAAIYFVIGSLNLLIEAYIFNVTDWEMTNKDLLQSFISTLLYASFLVWLCRKSLKIEIQQNPIERSSLRWVGHSMMGIFLYIVFYLSAGLILHASYPALMDYYADKLPDMQLMILTQIPRGLLFTFISILIVTTSRLSLLKTSVLVGLIFSVLGGIAPLMNPSELMPFNIRMVHTVEVGISNFLYGLVLSYFWVGDRKKKQEKKESLYV